MAKTTRTSRRFSYFLDLFFKELSFPFFIQTVKNTYLDTVMYEQQKPVVKTDNFKLTTVYDFPNYLCFSVPKDQLAVKQLIAPLYPGYLADLRTHTSADEYILHQVGKARSSKLRRHQKRLDLCLEPNYTMYYGAIDKIEYDRLFRILKQMTALRFSQKNENNFELPYLDYYQDIMFTMVLEKRAAIYVIYVAQKPINITLNFLNGQTLLHFNSCFDIDYSMFNLGHLNTIMHLRWCYDNKLQLFDMGRGDFFHKRQWINTTYTYEKHIFYNAKNPLVKLKAKAEITQTILRYQLIASLKKIKFHILYGKMRKTLYKLRQPKESKKITYTVKEGYILTNATDLVKIAYEVAPYTHLIFYVNAFLHKNFELKKNCQVYQNRNAQNTFIIKGKNNIQELQVH
jgi:hypothetical protein